MPTIFGGMGRSFGMQPFVFGLASTSTSTGAAFVPAELVFSIPGNSQYLPLVL